MKTYLILIREPDGRVTVPPPDETQEHQKHWQAWISDIVAKGHWGGGSSLTLVGAVMHPAPTGPIVSKGLYQVNGQEIVGGYLLLKADMMNTVIELLQTSPVFEADGFVEIREVMGT